MKTRLTSMMTLAALGMFATATFAQDQGQMYALPGPEQAALAKMAGEWDVKMTCHMLPEGAEKESTGTYAAKMDLGGYFLIGDFKGSFAGMPFQGHGVTGYDPFQKKYVGTWSDSMGPVIFDVTGEFDKTGKVYEERMEGPGPDGKPMKFHSTMKLVSDDQMTWKMSMVNAEGEDELMMESVYTKKK